MISKYSRFRSFGSRTTCTGDKDSGLARRFTRLVNMLYQVLLGQEKGPRFGSFVAVYGIENTWE